MSLSSGLPLLLFGIEIDLDFLERLEVVSTWGGSIGVAGRIYGAVGNTIGGSLSGPGTGLESTAKS